MYKFKSRQISFTDFNTPIGMKLNPDNRWVKKAEMIPWDEIEQRYAKLFTNRKGNVAKPLRLALGACIIQAEYGFSDEEVALQIQETAYLQFVTRLQETTCHCLAMSVLLLNLRKITKVLFTKILIMFQNMLKIYSISKMAFIQ